MFTYTEPCYDSLGNIQTPPYAAKFLYEIVRKIKPKVVLDPSCGIGNLLAPWFGRAKCIGIETNPEMLNKTLWPEDVQLLNQAFENTTLDQLETVPDLVLCNPPWNRHWERINYPEVFVRKIVTLFGPKIPFVLLCPMGFRLNQRDGSSRWRWVRDTLEISSVIACPIDLYPDTEFHSEIILFNFGRKVKPHYWMAERVDSEWGHS